MRNDMDPRSDMPAGTKVALTKDDGSVIQTVTRSKPWQLGHGQWVVLVDGIAGGYALSRVRPIHEA